jgi:CheY-like chemotaxis protein
MNPLLGRQLSILFQRNTLTLWVQLSAALAMAAILFNKVSTPSLTAWLIGVIVLAGSQRVLSRAFLSRASVARPALWHSVGVLVNLVTGLIWGLLALIQSEISSLAQVALVVTTALIAASVLWSTAPSAVSFPAFIFGLLLPWGAALFHGALPVASTVLAFAGFSAVYLGLFFLFNRQAMELARMQIQAARVARPVASAQSSAQKHLPVARSVPAESALSAVVLGARNTPPYSGEKRRASDQRNNTPLLTTPKLSSFGQLKIYDIVRPEPLEPSACTILVVEDNIDNQLLTLHLLQKRGYRVVIANNGREALAAVERQRFELILMDIQMPEMGGLEATAAIRLKEKQSAKRVPIVALTANPISESREICLATGMDDYLQKPISRTRLFAALDAHLNKNPRPAP